MKTLKTTLLVTLTLLIIPILTGAQDDKPQSYWIHEDVVKPAMLAEYETTCKELTENMKKHTSQEMNVLVTQTTDNSYLWISPISSFADIDRPIFKTALQRTSQLLHKVLANGPLTKKETQKKRRLL